jgi:hypothetical protein
LLFSRLVLNDVPIFNKNAVLDTQYVSGNSIHGKTEAAEAAMHYYKVTVGENQSGFVLQGHRRALYKVE